MRDFLKELKHVGRRVLRTPLFTAVTLLTLAVGIGANTAIFSVVSSVLLKPLPFREPDRLIAVWQTAPGMGIKDVNASPSTYFTYREESRTFEDIGLWRNESVTITGLAEPEQVESLVVTDGTLPILGVRPARGRWFSRKDDSPGSPETALLSYGYWERRFGGSDSALGRRILVDGTAREIIGVLPRDFRFMNTHPAVVLPFQMDRGKAFIGNFSYQAVARLKSGATVAMANADVARMIPLMFLKFRPFAGLDPKLFESAHFGPNVRPPKQDVVGDVGKVLWILMATVGIVLLIACANIANLLLVRAEGRQQELAIRTALGAGWGRIARELLLESVTLGIAGGIAGLGLAWAALRLLVYLAPANLPRLDEIAIDPYALLFTFLISLAAGVLFGLLPVYKYASGRVNMVLRQGGRTSSDGRERHRARSVLVIAQVALALVLLVSAGLIIRTLQALQHVQPGFTHPEQILTLRISIPDASVPDDERAARMDADILERISAVPGVASVSGANSITMDGFNDNDPITSEDRPSDEGKLTHLRRFKFVAPGFFRTMGDPLLAGRDVTWTDIYEHRPVVLVSENLARELWNDPAAAIGKRIHEPKGDWREIIGVVGNEHDDGVDQKAPTVVYWPFLMKHFWQFPTRVERTLAFAVRSPRAGSAAFLKDIQRAVWSVNPNLPLANVRTVQEIYGKSMARTSFTLVMLSLAAGMALLLGVIGLYGVISYAVSQRTREIGIRVAVGAQPGRVTRMFLGQGLLLAGIGVLCGVFAALSLARLMSGLLYGVSPFDAVTYAAVAGVLLSAALVATYIPARRAATIEPMSALRSE